MHNKIFLNYSMQNPLYTIKSKKEIEQINRVINNYKISLKINNNNNNNNLSKLHKNNDNELINLRNALNKTIGDKERIQNEYDNIKTELQKLKLSNGSHELHELQELQKLQKLQE